MNPSLPITQTFTDCSVDAANIAVYDTAMTQGRKPLGTQTIEVGQPGVYQVKLTVAGFKPVTGQLETTSGAFHVGDCCYGLSHRDDWAEIIKNTDRLAKSLDNLLLCNLKRDGGFNVTVTIDKARTS